MKNLLQIIAIAAVTIIIATGCASKPKLSLTDIQTGNIPANDAGNFGNGGFDAPDFNDPAFNEVGAVTDAGIGNAWSSSTDSMSAGEAYLVNPRRWAEKVYFAYNRSEIRSEDRKVLDELADYLAKNPEECVVVEGNTDERGSDEYNRALGERRAIAAMDYLQKLGIANSRIITLSLGEDRPAVQNAGTESEYQQNRRDEFLVGKRR